ncbi:MAG: hypothetical protein OER77_07405, partial [Myxococcales bacterium]|nr:hypothetical protein [Myxococcales bacterium]
AYGLSHLWPALQGASAFAAASPVSWLSQAACTAVVIAFLLAYVRGWATLRREAPEGPGPYRSVGCRGLQRWAGAMAWGLVLGHLGLEWFMLMSAGPASLSHYELLRGVLSMPVVLGLYLVGLGALGVYLSQGIAASFRALGFAEGLESSRLLEVGCTLLSAMMLLMAINILSHFSTGRAYWTSSPPPVSGADGSPTE